MTAHVISVELDKNSNLKYHPTQTVNALFFSLVASMEHVVWRESEKRQKKERELQR